MITRALVLWLALLLPAAAQQSGPEDFYLGSKREGETLTLTNRWYDLANHLSLCDTIACTVTDKASRALVWASGTIPCTSTEQAVLLPPAATRKLYNLPAERRFSTCVGMFNGASGLSLGTFDVIDAPGWHVTEGGALEPDATPTP